MAAGAEMGRKKQEQVLWETLRLGQVECEEPPARPGREVRVVRSESGPLLPGHSSICPLA